MVSIIDCSSKGSLSQLLKGDRTLQKDSPPCDRVQEATGESRIPVILAKAAAAAKMQIADRMGDGGRARPGSETAFGGVEDTGGVSMQRTMFNEKEMIRNLKEIVANDRRWALFAMGALGLGPDTESCKSLRDCLLKDIKEDTWNGIVHLADIYSPTPELFWEICCWSSRSGTGCAIRAFGRRN